MQVNNIRDIYGYLLLLLLLSGEFRWMKAHTRWKK